MKQTFLEEKKKVRRVDFFIYEEDFEAALLGSLGMTSNYIASRTNLTHGKISYRLRKAKIRRSDYRNGESTIARLVMRNLRPVLKRELVGHLKQL